MHMMPSENQKYPDGSQYRGPLRDGDGLRHGANTSMTHADGSVYNGQFENGLYHGLGVLSLADQSKYEGQFVLGKFHGIGVYTKSNGLKYQGEFMEGKILGKGRITLQDGSSGQPRNEGYFENFVLKKRQNCANIVENAIKMAAKANESV